MNCWEMVKEFTVANGQENYDDRPEVVPAIPTAVLRLRLIQEELGELSVALHERKVIDAADGFADLLYVSYGIGVAYGAVLGNYYEERTKTKNMDLSIFDFQMSITESIGLVAVAMWNYSCDCGINHNKPIEHHRLRDELRDLIIDINTGAADFGLPLKPLFNEVHRSNMTKTFGKTVQGAKYAEGGGKGPNYSAPDIAGVLLAHGIEPEKDGWL